MPPKKPFWNKKDQILNKADEYTLDADILAFQSRYEEAVEKYDKALEIVPNNADVWAFKGITLSGGLGRHDEAMQCWDRAKRLDPHLADAIEQKNDEPPPLVIDKELLCGRSDSCREKIRVLLTKMQADQAR